MPVIVQCANCGESIERSIYHVRRNKHHFCDRACNATWLSVNRSGENSPSYNSITVKCEHCGKEFQKIPANIKIVKHHFCSKKCTGLARQIRQTFTCDFCSAPFERRLSDLQDHKHLFCNNQCRGKWRSENWAGENSPFYDRTTVYCDQCNSAITRAASHLKDKNRHFCNRKCFGRWMSAQRGENHPLYDRITVACDYCGILIEKFPSQLKTNAYHFCNSRCFGDWRIENWTGENNPLFRGGIPHYYGPNWYNQRKCARKRDGHTCQKCGKSEQDNGRALDVHHIIPFCEFDYAVGENENYKQANELTNLISLCMSCHQRVERGIISVQLPLSISSA